MRKRTILALLALVFVSAVMANPVDPQRAIKVAQQFVPKSTTSHRAPMRGSQSEPSSSIVYTHMMPNSNRPAFYIVNVEDGAFVLVSADDIAHQILGYSLSSTWPVSKDGSVELPEQIKGFFDDLAAQMEAAIETEPNRAPESDWTSSRSLAPTRSNPSLPDSIGPLLTTTWNQGQYYNSLCPEDADGPGGRAQTGCVATAMAQIVKYWSDPTPGRGTHSYSTNYGTLTVNYAEASYNYASMPNLLDVNSTQEQINAVAQLIYHCGVATNMEYSPSESSAMDRDTRAGLINFYRFSPNLSYAEKAFFTDTDWNELLHQEIAANRPVLYSGFGNSGGHTFICDGYKADNYYHFNFGWGGFCDGWYLTSAINPNDLNYNSTQTALVGIVPDASSNVILGLTTGNSTFTVDEPLEFYHLMGHNAYFGINYSKPYNSTMSFIPIDNTKQIVVDFLEYEDQSIQIHDGISSNNLLRSLSGDSDNDLNPIISTTNAITIDYTGNMSFSGFTLSISQDNGCRMVSNITSTVETTTVNLSWTENGNATQWQLEYGEKGFELGSGIRYNVNTNTVTFNNLQKFNEYDFYIRSVNSNNIYGLWNKVTLLIDAPYWTDIVTTQPEGYEIDENGNVTVSTAEGLAWWAKLSLEQEKFWRWMVYHEPFVGTIEGLDSTNLYNGWYYSRPITINNDINLGDYKWKPVNYYGAIDGNGHIINNLTIIEEGGEKMCGFLKHFSGRIIKNITFQNPYLCCNDGYYGILAGSIASSTIQNIGINKGKIVQDLIKPNVEYRGLTGGGLIGSMELTKIFNCYSNCIIKSRANSACTTMNGGLVGYANNLSEINNCYSASSILTAAGWTGSICAYANGVSMQNCYGIDYPYLILGYNEENTGGIVDTMQFNKNTHQLIGEVFFDGEGFTNLLDALNRRVSFENNEALRTWSIDFENNNDGFPVLSDQYKVLCPNTKNISAKNVNKDGKNIILLTWDDDDNVARWSIKCTEADSLDVTSRYYFTNDNSIEIDDLNIGRLYRINVKPICDETIQGGWGNGVQHVFDKPYWTDLVTSQPNGYTEDDKGNVFISSTEGFVWLSCLVNALNGQEYNSFQGKHIFLTTDVDLSNYRWMPIANTWSNQFKGSFNGCNHTIRNIYVNEMHDYVGLFGILYQGQVCNTILEGCVVKGYSKVGAICGYSMNWDFSWEDWNYGKVLFENCQIYNTTIYGDNQVGTLCGLIQNHIDSVIIRNCSSSGDVYGYQAVGGLLGDKGQSGFSSIINCFSSCNIHNNKGSHWYRGGLIGYFYKGEIINSYSSGHVDLALDMTGQVIGVLDDASGNYLYGSHNENGLSLIGVLYNDSKVKTTSSISLNNGTITLDNSVTIDDNNYSDFIETLNAWVDANNAAGQYRHWIADTANVNGGYPIFAPMPKCIVAFKNANGETLQIDTLEYGSLPVYRESTPTLESTTQYAYTFKVWSESLAPVTHDVTFTALYDAHMFGDVTDNAAVDVQDATIVVNYILGERLEGYLYHMADMNKDTVIDVFDLTAIINVILGKTSFQAPMRTGSSGYESTTYLLGNRPANIVGEEDVYLRTVSDMIGLSIANASRFTSFQMDIEVPEGAELQNVELTGSKNTHFVQKAKIGDNLYRVIALSMSSQPLADSIGELVTFQITNASNAELSVSNVMFVTPKGEAHYFNGASTMTPTIVRENTTDKDDVIFDLSGRRIYKKPEDLERGVYIINNEKIIIK